LLFRRNFLPQPHEIARRQFRPAAQAIESIHMEILILASSRALFAKAEHEALSMLRSGALRGGASGYRVAGLPNSIDGLDQSPRPIA
jgi:hypothetical protein